MCTVTWIPSGKNFIFTSSRDESAMRPSASFPELLEINGHRLLFPRDTQAGGTWIAVQETGNAAVLLNGAIRAHQPEPSYRKSRGLVLLDLIAHSSPLESFDVYDCNRIEPFTVVLLDDKKLYCGSWDGRRKRMEPLNVGIPHIWSSVTLYDAVIIQKREGWFNKWIAENPEPTIEDIIHFHEQGGDGDPVNDLLMNRNGNLYTNSISSVRISPDTAAFRYVDLRSGVTTDSFLPFQNVIIVKA